MEQKQATGGVVDSDDEEKLKQARAQKTAVSKGDLSSMKGLKLGRAGSFKLSLSKEEEESQKISQMFSK